MNVGKIDNTQSFQGIDFRSVCKFDKTFIKKDLEKLHKLGEKYDIKLTSIYTNTLDFRVMDVDVKPLNKNLSFWEKFFPPIGRSTFHTNENSIIESVQNAIEDLALKIKNRKNKCK